jgi:cellulose biosynthesis protein BcsQ
MIYSFQQITAIRNYLQNKQKESKIAFKFKLVKHLNHATSIYIYDETEQIELNLSDITIETPIGAIDSTGKVSINDDTLFPPVDVRYVSKEDYVEDKKHYDVFFNDKSSFEGVTRRLDNAFGKYAPVKKDKNLPPIVSFYSYKGGVGRTTTLSSLASYHARRIGAKVLILDCDFEAPGLINFFGMNEDDLASKGGIVEYLTDVTYLSDKKSIDIRQYIHTISTGASRDPLGYAGDKGIIYVMNAGNVSVNNISTKDKSTTDLRSHQDHYLHGMARLDFSNPDNFVLQFQEMLIKANEAYQPDVILLDSRTGFNDVFNNIALRLSDIVVGLFGTSKQNIPGIYNFLDTIVAENQEKENSLEVVLVNSIASNVRQSYKNFKKQLETYNQDTENEINPEVFSIEYIPRMAEIGTPTDEGDILLDYTDPNRCMFPDYHGKGVRLLEHLSTQIEKKSQKNNSFLKTEKIIEVFQNSTKQIQNFVKSEDILIPLKEFFTKQNISYAENLGAENKEFLEKFYYFRNYLRDIFRRETFLIRGYKGTGKTLLYHALEDTNFVEKLKKFNNISEDFRFVNIVDPNNILHLSSLNFKPQNTGDKIDTYYRRFWVIYIWNVLLQKFPEIYQSKLSHFQMMSDETTRSNIETLMKTDKMLEVEYDLRKLNEIFIEKKIVVVISFDYLDKIVETSEWNANGHPIAQLINFGQNKSYSNFYTKIFIRTDLFQKIQYINNANALENRVLSLDWTTEELFAYFFKVVYKTTGNKFIEWLISQNPEKRNYITSIENTLLSNDAQIPLDQKDMLIFLVNNFFGEFSNPNKTSSAKSYEWFYINLKNANDVVSLRPFIALLAFCFDDVLKNPTTDKELLSGKFFTKPIARATAAVAHLTDILKDYDEILKIFLETFHKSSIDRLERFRFHSISHENLRLLIINIFELNNLGKPDFEMVQNIVEMLKNAGIIKQETSKKVSYSFAFLYKFYLRLGGNPSRK